MFAFSFIAGGLPPVAGGVRSAPLRFAACSPHVRRIDKTVHCIISVLYVTILIKSEREKERNLTRQPNNCPFLFGMSFSLCIVLEMLLYVLRIDKPVHCIISVLYVTILIKRERAKERKSERAKERKSET